MDGLHFTLGKDAGKLLAQVAQEHLLYNLDPTKAIETFTKSFIGLPVEMATKLLSGELVVEVDDDGVNVVVVPRDETKHSDYPEPYFAQWYGQRFSEIEKNSKDIYSSLEGVENMIAGNGGVFEFEFNYKSLGKFISEHDVSDIEDVIDGDPRIERLRRVMKLADMFLRQTYKLWRVFDFLEKVYPEQINPFNQCLAGERHTIVTAIAIKLNNLAEFNYDIIEANVLAEDNEVKKHLEAALKIVETLKSLIQPVAIINNYSAGWLSPNGDFYGLNGEISNMLHLNLADAIRNKYRVKDGIDIGENPDRWLEQNGWVKTHGDWVLYSGYDQSRLGRKDIPLTNWQVKQLVCYGNACHRGILKVGYQKEPIPATRLNIVDDAMLRSYFSL